MSWSLAARVLLDTSSCGACSRRATGSRPFNRGRLPDPFGDRIERLRGDRTTADFARLLSGRRFDATVDFAAYTAADVTGVVEVLGTGAGHYVFISTGQVYLVRQDCPHPAREEAYEGPLLPQPEEPDDLAQWRYGVEKRQAEDTLSAAWQGQGFASTRLRLPMGERRARPLPADRELPLAAT